MILKYLKRRFFNRQSNLGNTSRGNKSGPRDPLISYSRVVAYDPNWK